MTIPSLLLSLCVAVALAGWTVIREGRMHKVAGRLAIFSVLVIGWRAWYYAGDFSTLNRQVNFVETQHRQLGALLEDPEVATALERCRPVTVPTHAPIPILRYRTGLGKRAIQATISRSGRPRGASSSPRASSTSSPSTGRVLSAPPRVTVEKRGRRARRPASSGSPATAAGPSRRGAATRHCSVPGSGRRWRSRPTPTPFLARAIELAEGGRGNVSPNPLVGAVVVRDGEVLGEGFHARFGGAHAERKALDACTADPRGAHALRLAGALLPPRADAALHRRDPRGRASRASSSPPTTRRRRPPAAGSGILRDEGVEVVVADGEPAMRARLLNQAFRKHARTGRPHVLFKSAMTLDGKVATRTGDSKWISGEAARLRSHHWRAERDAVVVGIGTALADDPQLNARIDGVTRQPRRVVFDSEGRLPLDSQLVTRRARSSRSPWSSAAPRRGCRPTRWRAPAPT